MNPNFAFDCRYISPHGACAYEFSKRDSLNCVDYSADFHESMVDVGLISEEGYQMVQRYRQIPSFVKPPRDVGVEVDCGCGVPAFFTPFGQNCDIQPTLNAMRDLLDAPHIPAPVVPHGLRLEEVGMMVGRGIPLLRFMLRGNHNAFADFVNEHGLRHGELIRKTPEIPVNFSALSFDWDGSEMTNFTFYSPQLGEHDRWVTVTTEFAMNQIRRVYLGIPHQVIRHVKIGLSDVFPEDYMKLYFTVRYERFSDK